jgi:hypothetical protein
MGSAESGLIRSGMDAMGEQRWLENQRKIEQFWLDLEKEVLALGHDAKKLHIYQDGLPCSGPLGERIVRETASRGSRNYQIVQRLMEQGAKIEATESAELLRQEYKYIKAILEAGSEAERRAAEERYDQVKDKLLEERDRFIARAIDASLPDGETGLLFIGAAHDVQSKLAGDIDVKCLD